MRLANRIVLASQNRDKFEEFQELLKTYPEIELVRVDEVLRNPSGLKGAEKFDHYVENAAAKARLVNQGSHYPTLADDSGLEVLSLEGKPGVRSQRYAPPRAGMSQDQANIAYLLENLKERKRPEEREARFVCHLALLIEGLMIQSVGTLEGTIIDHPRGEHGFGYDSIFVPRGSNKTLAEMTSAEKNAISHRAKALASLMATVRQHGIVFAKP
jgi:XTP/dITP diphosphohydrolase